MMLGAPHYYAPHPMGGHAPGHHPGFGNKPVGIFWDIENCPIPKGKKASAVIHFVRNFFVVNRLNHREYEFLIACDITKLRKDVPDDINRAGGVTLAHVSGVNKNAADEKLRESMKKFVDTHASLIPTLVLISGDIDFVNDLRGYQTRLGCVIVVVYGSTVSEHFKQGWNERYEYQAFTAMMEQSSESSSVATSGPAAPNKVKQDKTSATSSRQPSGAQPPKDNTGQMFSSTMVMGADADSSNPPISKRQQKKAMKAAAEVSNPGPTASAAANSAGMGPGLTKAEKKAQKANQAKNGLVAAAGNAPMNSQPNFQRKDNVNGAPLGGPRPRCPNPPLAPQPYGKQTPPNQANQRGQRPSGPTANIPKGFQPMAPGNPNQRGPRPFASNNGPPANPQGQGPKKNKGQEMGASVSQLPKDNGGNTNAPNSKFILMVSGLPGKMDFRILKDHLQDYASSVSGKVMYVHNGQAFISFKRKEDAEKAIALFEGKEVYGKTLRINYAKSIPFPNSTPTPGVVENEGGNPTGVVAVEPNYIQLSTGSQIESDRNNHVFAENVAALAATALNQLAFQEGQASGGQMRQMKKSAKKDPNCVIQ